MADGFHKLFGAKTVSIAMAATSRSEVLGELVDLAIKGGRLDAGNRESILRALIARERVGSTGIGTGIAIPHVKTNKVTETVTAAGVTKIPVDFRAVDGEPCNLFFLLLSPTAMADTHLAVLKWLSKLVRNPDFCRFMRAAKTPREAVGLFKEMSE